MAGYYDYVFPRLRNSALIQPEPFSNDPLDAVAPYRRPKPLLDNKAQSMICKTVWNEIQTEMGGFRSFSRFFDALEIGGATNSFMRPETELAPQRFLIRRFQEPISSQTDSRFLPFARRRFSTLRPAFVDIRSRKP